MNRQAHFEQVIARARGRANLIVHDGRAPLDANGQIVRASYVVLHDLGPDDVHLQYTEQQSVDTARTMRVVGRCVGVDPAAARRVADAFAAQMDKHVLLVPGRECWPIKVDDESEVKDDTNVSPPLAYVDIDLTYRTFPKG